MKKILFILSMFLSGICYSQSVGYFRYDTTVFQKIGGNNELKILNGTKGIAGGVLTNMGGGRTAFDTSLIASYIRSTIVSGTVTSSSKDTLTILGMGQSNLSGDNDGRVDTTRNLNVVAWNGSAYVVMQRGVLPMGQCTPGVKNSVGCGTAALEDSATSAVWYFSKRIQEKNPNKIVRVIISGYAGNGINAWIPAASTNFANVVSQMAAIGNPKIDYMFWDQGEANAGMTDSTYKNRVDTVIAQLGRTSFFSKSVPIFIVSVRDTAVSLPIQYVQMAIGSGLYDKRYIFINAWNEPYYNPSPFHFSAQGQYNIANKAMQSIFNKPDVPNGLFQLNSAQRTQAAISIVNIGKGLSFVDSTNKSLYTYEQPLIKTSIFNGQLTLKQTGDNYGESGIVIKNSGTTAGFQVYNNAFDISGMNFRTNSANENVLWYVHSGSTLSGNTNGEMQFYKPGVGQYFSMGEVNSALQSNLYIGSATVVPSHALTVGGQIRVTNMTTGANTDSVVTILGGQLRKIIASSIVASTPMNNILAATGSNDVDHGDNQQTWRYNALAQNHHGLTLSTTGWAGNGVGSFGGGLLQLISTSTAFTGSAINNLAAISAGASNSNSSVTTVGLYTAINSVGTTSTNIGAYYDVSSATNNYAIIVNTGLVGIGATAPTAKIHIGAGTATASTAPLKFTSGTNLTTAEAGAVEYDGSNIYFTPTGTIRKTIATNIVSRSVAQNAAVAAVATQTVGAADASYIVSANVLVTTATAHSFTVTCAYTDEGNTARTITMNFSTLAGVISNAAITNVAGTVPYEGIPLHIRAKASTTITVATTGTFTTVTYNVEGRISKIN
jgi:Carbohydrate esterase, sialic acid-specific acetylesterase